MSQPISKIPVPEVDPAVHAANAIIEALSGELNRRVTEHSIIRDKVYSDPNFTPAQIFAAWGTRGKKIFEAGAANAADIRAQAERFGLDPDSVFPASAYLPPIPVTIHDDGTVTTP